MQHLKQSWECLLSSEEEVHTSVSYTVIILRHTETCTSKYKFLNKFENSQLQSNAVNASQKKYPQYDTLRLFRSMYI